MDPEKISTTTIQSTTDTIISTLLTTSNQDETTEINQATGQSFEIFKSHLYFSVLDYFVFSIMLALSGIFFPSLSFYCAKERERFLWSLCWNIHAVHVTQIFTNFIYCHEIISMPKAYFEVYDKIIQIHSERSFFMMPF